MENSKKNNAEFIPTFRASFLKPRFWGSWLAVGAFAALAMVPASLRDPVLGKLGRTVGRLAHSARRRAQINLYYCMPEKSHAEREQITDDMFATAPQSMVMMAELALRPQKATRRVRWQGRELIDNLAQTGENVIFMVPHGWAIDIPAMLLASEGHKVAGMFNHQRDPVIDYVWNRVRCRFGGRLHARDDGIKPFISSVREGCWGYYLPDQDHGAEHSEFVDFFATYKATLPILGRLMKVCKARVVPLFPVYDAKSHTLTVHVRPPMDDLWQADDAQLARRMNEEVEIFVRPNPEQYTWILKLLKTRKPDDIEPYDRQELFPKK